MPNAERIAVCDILGMSQVRIGGNRPMFWSKEQLASGKYRVFSTEDADIHLHGRILTHLGAVSIVGCNLPGCSAGTGSVWTVGRVEE